MSATPPSQTKVSLALYPGEVLRTLRDGFTRKVLVVKGRLRRGSKAYRNGFYHSLVGEEGDTLTLLCPPALDARLPQEDGYLVTVRGYLDYTLSESRIQAILQLSEVLSSEAAPAPDPQQKLMEQIAYKERRDVPTLLRRALLSGKKPRLLFLYAREAIVDHDVEKALGPYRSAYEIKEERVAFNPEMLSGFLISADGQGYDAIAVIRGGGSGLEALNNPRVVEAALNLKTPLIAALGHARDRTLLASTADWRVETPSLLGTALRDLAVADSLSGRAEPVRSVEASQPGSAPTKPVRQGINWEPWLYRVLGLAMLGWLLWRWLS